MMQVFKIKIKLKEYLFDIIWKQILKIFVFPLNICSWSYHYLSDTLYPPDVVKISILTRTISVCKVDDQHF